MNFKSQICTTKEQSERLLALGLKKVTADCVVTSIGSKDRLIHTEEPIYVTESLNSKRIPNYPAWSFHRLIEMMPSNIIENERRYNFSLGHGCSLYTYDEINEFGYYEYDCIGTSKITSNLYNDLINQIEWLIKEGHFNKEYLN